MARTLVRLAAAAAATLALMLLLGVLLTYVLVHGWVGRTDDAIERSLLAGRTSLWNTLTNAGTQLAQPVNVAIALLLLLIGLAVVTRGWIAPAYLALAVGLESGIYFVTSTLVHRPRPSIPRLGVGDPNASYPSGHVAVSICLYGGLAVLAWVMSDRRWLQWLLTTLAIVIPVAVGLSRMYRGFHHLSDVIAGAILGLVWLTLCTRIFLLPALAKQSERPGTGHPLRNRSKAAIG